MYDLQVARTRLILTNMMDIATQNKLYWQCRRGMWELDLYLVPFVRERLVHLSPDEQNDFTTMLEIPDVELHACLNGHTEPTNVDLKHILGLVREHAKISDKSSVF